MRHRLVTAVATLVVASGLCTAPAPAQTTDPVTARVNEALRRGREAFANRPGGAPGRQPAVLGKKAANDPVGDAGDPRADITKLSASYNAEKLALSLKVVQPTNPATDPAWTDVNAFAAVEWAIETTGDDEPEYFVIFGAGPNGKLFADVIPLDEDFVDTQVCRGAQARFERGTYIVTAPTRCVGSAPHIWVGGAAIYVPDIDGDDFGFDFAPDVGFMGPIAGPPGGYLLSSSDGGVFAFGSVRFRGSLGHLALTQPIVDVAATPNVAGYTMLGADGGVFTFGNAVFAGSAVGLQPNGRYVGIAATPSGRGYWLATSNGAVLAFGDARFFGSTAGFGVGAEIVDIAATRSGRGYFLVTSNGGVLGFGDARYRGSAIGLSLRSPILTIAPTSTGLGYFLIARDGGVFTYGDARFRGSTGNLALRAPIVGVAVTITGKGYNLIASDGGVFTYGDARFFGSAAPFGLRAPIVAIAAL
jgi:hypothetical protein